VPLPGGYFLSSATAITEKEEKKMDGEDRKETRA
jgi:hypothetical protein